MLNIKKFVCNMFQENCYVANDETKECVIIDCGALYPEEKEAISRYIKDNGLTPKHLLCTHGHVDHNFGNKFIYEEYGLKPEVCEADACLMDNLAQQAKNFTGMDYANDFPAIGSYLDEEHAVTFGTHRINIINTPGHTPGSVFLYCEDEAVAFSGDTLFRMSVGRTDLGLGDFDALMCSLKKIINVLQPDTTILSGHGIKTTLEFEEYQNPYLKVARTGNG